ncbi:hypothetical protein J7M00_08615 [bacterium]|nr:hypothetical protein [bacterium]
MVHKQRLKSLQSDPVKFYREFLKVRGESLHDYQKQFLRCGARIVVVLKGRSIGISWASAIKALHRAVMFPNQTVLIVSWNEDQAKQILEYAKMFVRRSRALQSLVTGRSSLALSFANGSRIIATGCTRPSASNVRNFHANLLIVDEAALIYDEMFAAITPVVRGMENPQEIYISTAGRIGSFFHRQFLEARKQGVPQGVEGPKGMAWFSIPSSECPRISPDDLRRERERLGKIRFEREYCCVFHGAANQVFPQIPRWNYVLPQKTERPCYIGIDVGLMVNPTVMLVLEEVPKEVDGEEKVVARTCRIFEWRRVSTQQMFREIQMILPNFNVKRMVVDVEGIGEGLFTLLLNANLPVHGMKIKDKQKNDLIFEVAEAFERKELWLPEEEDERHRELVFELEGYTAEPSKSKPGIYVFDSVVGREDYVIALALAWHARKIESYQPRMRIIRAH